MQLITAKSCRTCKFSATVAEGMQCRRYPPTTTIFPIPVNGRVSIQVHSAYGPINPDEPCGEHLPRIEAAAAI